ncbi:MAG TPA: hypothetical protein PLH94_09235 [Fimbriimonadaceae bacterium]|nr:hypothetical protein [Fimbriimonadaceae bacterium]
MKLKLGLAVLIAHVALFGCGGGGGGGGGTTGFTVVGRVIALPSGGAPNPTASVQVGQASVLTSSADGSFSIQVPDGSDSLLVLWTPGGSTISFRYTIPPPTGGTANVGDLYVGLDKVTVEGRVVNANDQTAVSGATLRFAGKDASTDSNGRFSLTEIAYSTANPTSFFDIVGSVTRPGFLSQSFRASTPAVSGIVTIGDVLIVPEGGNEPPGSPYNITGTVQPRASAPGTVVTLLSSGTPIRRMTVGTDSRYGFWVVAGSYTIRYQNPNNGLSAPEETVTLASQDSVVNRDVTLR